MSSIDLTYALDLALNLSKEVNTYWAYYLSVAGIITGLVSSGKLALTQSLKLALSSFFIIWAFSNLFAILNLAEQRRISIDLVLSLTDGEYVINLMDRIKPHCDTVYILYHALIDSVVLYVLWFMKPTTLSKKSKEE